MKFKFQAVIALLFAITCNVIAKAQLVEKDFIMTTEERDKRAVDLGDFVRNLLLKSATASNVKGNIARNVVKAKATTPAPRRRTTTTLAPLFVKGPLKFPFDLSALSGPPINKFNPVNKFNPINKFNNAGYINFDYNDYGDLRPVQPARRRRPTTTTTTSTTTTTTTTRAPLPARRRPLRPIHYGQFGKAKLNYYNSYDDYDYNYDDPTATAAPPPPPPPAVRPRRPPTANRARIQNRLPQLRNRLVYQYAQPDDTSTNDDTDYDDDVNTAAASDANEQPQQQQQQPTNATEENSNNETSANTNDYNDDTDETANNSADPNNVEDYNDSSDNNNANANINANDDNTSLNNENNNNNSPNVNTNFNRDSPNIYFNVNPPQFAASADLAGNNAQAQFQLNGPGGANAYGASAGFQYPAYNDFTTQYQQPSSPAAYSVRYF